MRGQGIYWSVVPFPLIEAARVWFHPSGRDRHRQDPRPLCRGELCQLSSLGGFPINYSECGRLLLGKPFFPAEARGAKGGAFNYGVTEDGGTDAEASLGIARGEAAGAIICAGSSTPSTSLRASSSASLPRQGAPVFSLNSDQTEASADRHFHERTFLFLGRTTPALTIDWSKLRPCTGEAPI